MILYRGTAALAIAAISTAWLTAVGVVGQSNTIVDRESYAVYAAVIPQEGPARHAWRIVLRQETVTNWGCVPQGRPLQEEWKPVMDDFVLRNLRPSVLLAGFDIGVQYLLVPTAEINAAFKDLEDGDWRIFHAQYPESGGFIEVSAVGFDPNKTRALVYVAHHCGGLCGGGTHHFLRKYDGHWLPARVPDLQNCQWAS
jgi:hypothetical protein